MQTLLSTNKLTVKFKDLTVLHDINISIYDTKKVIGLVGPNGAGKTTLIHSILGLNNINGGNIKYYGKHNIAYCPDTPEFESKLTCYQIMEQSLLLANKTVENKYKKICNLLNLVGLERFSNRNVQGFSRGMKQRLGIASALILDPKLIFLDEPTSALDPIGREEIIKLISDISTNTNVIMSSHNLDDVQRISSNIIVINEGYIIYQGNINKFMDKFDKNSYISLKNDYFLKKYINLLNKNNIIIKNIDYKKYQIYFNESDFSNVLSILCEYHDGINKIIKNNNSLNDAFINTVRNMEN
ncbi:ABC transporter ATP-binding protein [Apilactobacillus timberlakei]|uniref:ABC transporter ATP-binding protein n=1 Tax=Apilactobacillus timberlakei TaxID=2008380 RepID=A0ABY2YW17_9LACO|nr:ABC transporter ATP-binding protein [Apilactobacillus timberlakei]TPR12313.1 ABC transporter ATP-binding protein [Apilactobacillus timberlakei]TPR12916.1 ABC transporter ATP-binding protein [Apilactobacillus timberlakei]